MVTEASINQPGQVFRIKHHFFKHVTIQTEVVIKKAVKKHITARFYRNHISVKI